jgi:hypothetical protein
MLNIRNLIFALSLSPLLSVIWQLPSQAQSKSPSPGTAGTNSGAVTDAAQTSIFSRPSGGTGTSIVTGVSGTILLGVSTTGNSTVGSAESDANTASSQTVTAANLESNSSSVTVKDGVTGNTIVINLDPQVQVTVNQLAAAIVQTLRSSTTSSGGTTDGGTTGGGTTGGGTTDGGTTGGGTTDGVTAVDIVSLVTGGAGSEQAAVAFTTSLTAAGISPQLATALVSSLNGLFSSTSASLPNQPTAQATSGQLVAGTKVFKPVSVIAQAGGLPSVNINKLNDAIVAYNGIILQSEPQAIKNLYRNGGFVGIGGILKDLRTAIK